MLNKNRRMLVLYPISWWSIIFLLFQRRLLVFIQFITTNLSEEEDPWFEPYFSQNTAHNTNYHCPSTKFTKTWMIPFGLMISHQIAPNCAKSLTLCVRECTLQISLANSRRTKLTADPFTTLTNPHRITGSRPKTERGNSSDDSARYSCPLCAGYSRPRGRG
jgi:hypothetical protein